MTTGFGTLISGRAAGRVQPINYTPPDGEWVIAFGSDGAPGAYDYVDDGDVVGFKQDVDLTGITLITLACKLRQAVTQFAASVPATGGTYPTGFSGGETLQIKVDGGGTQTFTFDAADQDVDEVVARIAATITDASVEVDIYKQVRIYKADEDYAFGSGKIEIVGGTGMATLGFSSGTTYDKRVLFSLEVHAWTGSTWADLLFIASEIDGDELVFAERVCNVTQYTGTTTLRFVLKANEQ